MSYDEGLAGRIRAAVQGMPGVEEKAMFGGIAWLRGGNVLAGIMKDELMVRVGKDGHDAAIAQPHARTMDFTGKPMRGFIIVSARGVSDVAAIREWVLRGLSFVETLPMKAAKKPPAAKKSRPSVKRRAAAKRRPPGRKRS